MKMRMHGNSVTFAADAGKGLVIAHISGGVWRFVDDGGVLRATELTPRSGARVVYEPEPGFREELAADVGSLQSNLVF